MLTFCFSSDLRFAQLALCSAFLSACSACPNEAAKIEPQARAATDAAKQDATAAKPRLSTAFDQPLETKTWTRWTHNLAAKKSRITPGSGGLHVDLETYGRAADEVSIVALAWNEPVDVLAGPQHITLSLDWLEDSNASYLSAGLAVIPEEATLSGDPRDLPAVTHLSFIGAGLGANARRELLVQRRGQEVFRDTEGWPEVGREGRKLGSVTLELTLSAEMMTLEEEGRESVSVPTGLGFARGRLVLFVASHSNSMRRAVRFTKLELR